MNAAVDATHLVFRPMTLPDIPTIMEIEAAAYPHGWSEGIFKDCLRVGYICWLAEGLVGVEAYGVMWVAAGEAHILNVCVRPLSQGQGYGRNMMNQLLRLAHRREAESAFLEVRASNEKAIKLYLSMGFEQVGVRKAYYPDDDGREDAIVMSLSLADFIGLPASPGDGRGA